MARLVLDPRLEQKVAAMVRAKVTRIARQVRDDAARAAPDGKTWLCVAADTPVTAYEPVAAARRYHKGPLVRVATASGRGFAVTPQHNVLTGSGWRAAETLHPGDHLFQVVGVEPARAPHVQHPPPAIGEVVDAWVDSALPVEVRTMGVPVDLDIDVLDCEVEVVAVDGRLAVDLEPRLHQGEENLVLVGAHELGQAAVLLGGCSGQAFGGLTEGPCRRQSGQSDTSDILRLIGYAEYPGLAPAPDRDACLAKDASYGWLGNSVLACDSALGGTSEIVLNECGIVDVIAAELLDAHLLRRAGLGDGLRSLEVPPGGLTGEKRRPALPQAPPNCFGTGGDSGGDLLGGLASAIAPDEIIDVQVDAWTEGHVYDLTTRGGWYLADGLVVHNSSRDERVRPSHRETDGQAIPGNLRYQLPAVVYVRKGRDRHGKAINPGGGWLLSGGRPDLARWPRDPELPVHQSIECRCESVPLPGAVGRSIHSDEATVDGARARATVWSRYTRVAESEFGTAKDAGAYFMTQARLRVAARYQARRV